MHLDDKLISRERSVFSELIVLTLIISIVLALVIYWIKSIFSFEEIREVSFIAFLGSILLYAWIGIILSFRYQLNYYLFSGIIGSEVLFKVLQNEGLISTTMAGLGFTAILCVGFFYLSRCRSTFYLLTLCVIYQLLLARDYIFNEEADFYWLSLIESLLLIIFAKLSQLSLFTKTK